VCGGRASFFFVWQEAIQVLIDINIRSSRIQNREEREKSKQCGVRVSIKREQQN
jgi:hypothetical protein